MKLFKVKGDSQKEHIGFSSKARFLLHSQNYGIKNSCNSIKSRYFSQILLLILNNFNIKQKPGINLMVSLYF